MTVWIASAADVNDRRHCNDLTTTCCDYPLAEWRLGVANTVTAATGDLAAKPLTGYKIALGWSLFWSAPRTSSTPLLFTVQ